MVFIIKKKPEFILPKRIYREDSPLMRDLGAGQGLPVVMVKFADISDDKIYRWELGRSWDQSLPVMCWIMLNPSKADSEIDDPTIRVCCGRAKLMGFGGIVVVNMFSYRSTSPLELYPGSRPGWSPDQIIGEKTDEFIARHITESDYVMVAWGNHGTLISRDQDIKKLLLKHSIQAWCLGLTATGQPKHPLRIAYAVQPIPWN